MQNAGAIWLSILGKVWKDKNDKIFQQGFFEIMIFFVIFKNFHESTVIRAEPVDLLALDTLLFQASKPFFTNSEFSAFLDEQ